MAVVCLNVRGFGQVAIGETEVELIVETTGREQVERISEKLKREGFQTTIEH